MKTSILITALSMLIGISAFAQKQSNNDDKTWSGFFKIFQAAVKSGDKNKISSLCDFSAMTKADFNENYQYFFLGDAKKSFAKAKYSDAERVDIEFEELSNASDFYQLTFFYNEKDEDGEEDESALIYYFAKVNGKFRLVNVEAAG